MLSIAFTHRGSSEPGWTTFGMKTNVFNKVFLLKLWLNLPHRRAPTHAAPFSKLEEEPCLSSPLLPFLGPLRSPYALPDLSILKPPWFVNFKTRNKLGRCDRYLQNLVKKKDYKDRGDNYSDVCILNFTCFQTAASFPFLREGAKEVIWKIQYLTWGTPARCQSIVGAGWPP